MQTIDKDALKQYIEDRLIVLHEQSLIESISADVWFTRVNELFALAAQFGIEIGE